MHRYWGNPFYEMMNFGNNAAGWFIAYEIVKLLITVALLIFIFRMFIKNSNNKSNSNPDKSRAIEILKERYASGEISEEEYKNKLNIINEK